jgi:hypothetical protein
MGTDHAGQFPPHVGVRARVGLDTRTFPVPTSELGRRCFSSLTQIIPQGVHWNFQQSVYDRML